MRGGIVVAAALLGLAMFGGPAASASSSDSPTSRGTRSSLAVLEEAVVSRIHLVRRGRGLRPLRLNRRLAAAADFHSRDMGRRGYFEHDSANGTPFWRRIERFYPSTGYRSWTVGENLLWASESYSAAFAVGEWMASPPHRANILSRDWREVGIGAVYFLQAAGAYSGRPVTIITADFGSRR
jgi:uncharacterized protein YkwD